MLTKLSQDWDLSTLYPGGSESPELIEFLSQLEQDVIQLQQDVEQLEPTVREQVENRLPAIVEMLQSCLCRVDEGLDFAYCLIAQNVNDAKAKELDAAFVKVNGLLGGVSIAFETKVTQIADELWAEMLQREELLAAAFYLNEKRQQALDKMAPELETLAGQLAVDGYHAYSKFHTTLMGRLQVPLEVDGETQYVSLPQVFEKLVHPERSVRAHAYARLQEAMSEQAELCAHALNHLAGFRLQLYRGRGWDSFLQEPLANERMSEQTLMAMWEAVERNLDRAVPFLRRKAQLLGVEHVSLSDQYVMASQSAQKFSYEEAAHLIVEQFGVFNPDMADFARKAFEEKWLDVAQREGKISAGFCARMPHSKQSRIYYTYHGSYLDVATIAHELGHAYHNHVTFDLPYLASMRGQSTAETASTFAEMIVADAALRNSKSEEERVAMLEAKAQNVVIYLMFTYANFLFEKSFYEERKRGLVSVERLNELMAEAQQTAYRGELAEVTPLFWTFHRHLYNTQSPFYNFPYTFGYLFSAGVYARAMEEGSAFAEKYVALLRDTGRMTVEELAERYLGVDLRKAEFWEKAIDYVMGAVEEFVGGME